MDVVSIPKTNESFGFLYDTKGRFRLHSIRDEESKEMDALKDKNLVAITLQQRSYHTVDGLCPSALHIATRHEPCAFVVKEPNTRIVLLLSHAGFKYSKPMNYSFPFWAGWVWVDP
ncbi:putative ribosomal protein S4e [Helianthus annuus]|nr:putative ribosomal protein S4e [Helianthus annuus]